MGASRIAYMWSGRDAAVVTVEGVSDAPLVTRLDRLLDQLLQDGAIHLVVGLQQLTGDDTAVLELLAATCHRLWRVRGTMEIGGLRHRLLTRPEVRAFPEVFGDVGEPAPAEPEAMVVPRLNAASDDEETAAANPIAHRPSTQVRRSRSHVRLDGHRKRPHDVRVANRSGTRRLGRRGRASRCGRVSRSR